MTDDLSPTLAATPCPGLAPSLAKAEPLLAEVFPGGTDVRIVSGADIYLGAMGPMRIELIAEAMRPPAEGESDADYMAMTVGWVHPGNGESLAIARNQFQGMEPHDWVRIARTVTSAQTLGVSMEGRVEGDRIVPTGMLDVVGQYREAADRFIGRRYDAETRAEMGRAMEDVAAGIYLSTASGPELLGLVEDFSVVTSGLPGREFTIQGPAPRLEQSEDSYHWTAAPARDTYGDYHAVVTARSPDRFFFDEAAFASELPPDPPPGPVNRAQRRAAGRGKPYHSAR